ncbi:hypothetical protein CUMW_133880 [Citrus unshiu]|nr:hypothetical protein CUMW_133880 [Citrus unshiu]
MHGMQQKNIKRERLDPINILILKLNIIIGTSFIVVINTGSNPFVQPSSLRQFTVSLEQAGLIRHVFQNNIGFIVLIISQTDKNNITRTNPNLFVHLTTDVAETLGAVDAHGLASTVPQHPKHLRVFLTVFLEYQLAFLVVRLVLSSLPILSSLSLVLRHLFPLLLFFGLSSLFSRYREEFFTRLGYRWMDE